MKIFLRKFLFFLLFLVLGFAMDLLLGLSVGTIFYLVRDKKLTEALDIVFLIILLAFAWGFVLLPG